MEIYWAGRALRERKFALASVVEVHVSSAAENMTPFSKQNILRLQNLRNWLVFFPLCTHLPLSAGGTEAVLPLNSSCQHKRCFGDPKDSLDLGLRQSRGRGPMEQECRKVTERRPFHPCFNSCQLHRHDEEMLSVWKSVWSCTQSTGTSVKWVLLTWGSSVIAAASLWLNRSGCLRT